MRPGRPPADRDWSFRSKTPADAVHALDHYACDGMPLELGVTSFDATLWSVPDEGEAATVRREGVRSALLWTAGELEALMARPGPTPDIVRTVAAAKVASDGYIVEVRPTQSQGAG